MGRSLSLLLPLLLAGFGATEPEPRPRKPQQAGQPMDPVETAARCAGCGRPEARGKSSRQTTADDGKDACFRGVGLPEELMVAFCGPNSGYPASACERRLTAYIAQSAWASKVATSSPSPGKQAMPTLASSWKG